MSLLAQLRSGECGVRMPVPAAFQVKTETSIQVQAVDSERQVVWTFTRLPFGFDARQSFEAEFRQDLEIFTRAEFESFARASWPNQDELLRTNDREWSPVIETEWKTVKGFPAVQVIRRLAYRPGCEIIVGHLCLPLSDGLFEISVLARSNFTGVRESALLVTALPKFDEAEGEGENESDRITEFMKKRRQSDYDDPKYDAQFPDHPLSIIRQCLPGWLTPTVAGWKSPSPCHLRLMKSTCWESAAG